MQDPKRDEKLELFSVEKGGTVEEQPLSMSEEAWRERLTPDQYHVVRKKGTERAFTGTLWNTKEAGLYRCVACHTDLFSSETKFDSGTGWPSFWEPVAASNVKTESDNSLFRRRTEVLCRRCDGHLGHVFEDGPRPTGQRYCINSASLEFVPKGSDSGGDEGA